MQIWPVQIRNKPRVASCGCGSGGSSRFGRRMRGGFTFPELVVVIVILSLLITMAQINLFGLLLKNRFKSQVQEFVSTLRMAVTAAAESDRRFEVIVDITEQRFILREITSPDLSQVLEEETITDSYFAENCRVEYVEFDDGDYTNEGRAKFRAGRAGWQYGGKIVFTDQKGKYYTVVINRLNRMVVLEQGDLQLVGWKAPEDVPW
mgnify:CR=1 FL=1